MRIETLKRVYKTIDEMNEQERKKAYDEWFAKNAGWFYSSAFDKEYENTKRVFEDIFNVSSKGWEISSFDYYSGKTELGYFWQDIETCTDPIRIAKYIYNNFASKIISGKYYSIWKNGKLANRRSNIIKTMNADLTGFCADYAILDPIYNCITFKVLYNSIDELFKDCYDNFFRYWKEDKVYLESYDAFIEDAEANELEFLVEGA